jgi:hypothetical protein
VNIVHRPREKKRAYGAKSREKQELLEVERAKGDLW